MKFSARFASLLALALFTALSLGADPAPAAHPAGTFVAVGYGGRRLSSRDGQSWENDQSWGGQEGEDEDTLLDVAFGLGRFVAAGGGPNRGRLVSTRDGTAWSDLDAPKGRIGTICFGNGRFVAGQDAGLLHSADGEHFEAGARLEWQGEVRPLHCAAGDTEAGFRFVLIGEIDLAAEQKRVSWRAATGDGTAFLHSALDTPPARDIAHGAGRFVVVGPGGLVESSHDGQTWQRHNLGVTDGFTRIVWTGQRFVISGGRLVWTSPDGTTWKAGAARLPTSVVWAREGWLGLGLAWGGQMHCSGDLATWKRVDLPPGSSLTAIAFGADGAK